MAQLDVCTTGNQEVAGLTLPGWQHSFVQIDHEIFSMVILSLPLFQERQLSVSGKRMCTILVYCPVNVCFSKLTVLDMIPLG